METGITLSPIQIPFPVGLPYRRKEWKQQARFGWNG
jgi:hypothetical protein